LHDEIIKGGVGWSMQHTWKGEEFILSFGWGNLRERERDHLEDLGWQDVIKMIIGELECDYVD
jgi:hypothetical protein